MHNHNPCHERFPNAFNLIRRESLLERWELVYNGRNKRTESERREYDIRKAREAVRGEGMRVNDL